MGRITVSAFGGGSDAASPPNWDPEHGWGGPGWEGFDPPPRIAEWRFDEPAAAPLAINRARSGGELPYVDPSADGNQRQQPGMRGTVSAARYGASAGRALIDAEVALPTAIRPDAVWAYVECVVRRAPGRPDSANASLAVFDLGPPETSSHVQLAIVGAEVGGEWVPQLEYVHIGAWQADIGTALTANGFGGTGWVLVQAMVPVSEVSQAVGAWVNGMEGDHNAGDPGVMPVDSALLARAILFTQTDGDMGYMVDNIAIALVSDADASITLAARRAWWIPS